MAFLHRTLNHAVMQEPCRCDCGWYGIVLDAINEVDNVARCPKCGEPVVSLQADEPVIVESM